MKYISDYVDGFDIVEQLEKRFYSTASSFDKDWIEFTNTHPYVYKGDGTRGRLGVLRPLLRGAQKARRKKC